MLQKFTVWIEYVPYFGYESDQDGRLDTQGRMIQRCKNLDRVLGVKLKSLVKHKWLEEDLLRVSCIFDCKNDDSCKSLEETIQRSFYQIQTASSIYQIKVKKHTLAEYVPKSCKINDP